MYDRDRLERFLAVQFAMVSRSQAAGAGMKESRIEAATA
jgi:hypothetical protein